MGNPKYKVGDIVTIKQLSEPSHEYRFGHNDMMRAKVGKSFKIRSVDPANVSPCKIPDDGYRYKLEGDTGDWSWASSMFEDPFDVSEVITCTEETSDINLNDFIRKKKCPTLDFTL